MLTDKAESIGAAGYLRTSTYPMWAGSECFWPVLRRDQSF